MKKELTPSTTKGELLQNKRTQGEWTLNWQREGYSISAEFPEGFKRIATLTPDNGYTTKEECKLNGMAICQAVNERQKLLDSNRELLETLDEAGNRIAYCIDLWQLPDEAVAMLKGEMDAINKAIKNNAKNIQP